MRRSAVMPPLRSRLAAAAAVLCCASAAAGPARAAEADGEAGASSDGAGARGLNGMDLGALKIVPCSEKNETCVTAGPAWLDGVSLSADGILGAARAASPLHGIEGGFGLALHKMFDDRVGFGGRFQLLSSAGQSVDFDGDRESDESTPGRTALAFSGYARYAWWLDPVDGNAWVGELGGGFMHVLHDEAPSGPFLEATLGFQTAWITHLAFLHGDPERPDPFLVGARAEGMLGLRLQQGLGPMSSYQALLAVLSYGGGQFSTPPRRGLFGPRHQPFDYAFGFTLSILGMNANRDRFGGGPFPQLGFTFALPLAGALTVRTMVDFGYVAFGVRDFDFAYSGLAGLRLNRVGPAPLYLEALAGYSFAFGMQPLEVGSGPIVDAAFGLHTTSCSIAAGAGFRGRFGVGPDNRDLRMIMLTWFWEYDSLLDHPNPCPASPYSMQEWTPPPAFPPEELTPPRVIVSTPQVVVPLPSVVVPPPVVIAPPPPPPLPPVAAPEIIVVPIAIDARDLVSGRVRLPPAALPLHRLRGAREIRVEIGAPPSTFGGLDAILRTTLQREGVSIAASTYRPNPYGTVNLVFTIVR